MTQYLVFDAGVMIRRLVPQPQQSHYIQLLAQWKREGFVFCAPTLWAYEVTSSLNKLLHFQQLEADEAEEALQLVQAMDVELVVPQVDLMTRAFMWTRQLNRAAAYDSFYLALAEARRCDFWTADSRLARAANQPWVKLVGA